MKVIISLTFLLIFFTSAFAQTEVAASAATVEEVYLAKDDGEGKAGEQATEFRTTDIPIYCVVLLDTSAKTTVKMNFVAVNVAGVRPDTKVVTASYVTKENQNRVNFSGRPDGKWTPGKYRVDLFLDGKSAKSLEFEIKGGAVNPNTAAKNFAESPTQKPKPKKTRQQ